VIFSGNTNKTKQNKTKQNKTKTKYRFGTSCFYEHRYRDGSLQQASAPRLKVALLSLSLSPPPPLTPSPSLPLPPSPSLSLPSTTHCASPNFVFGTYIVFLHQMTEDGEVEAVKKMSLSDMIDFQSVEPGACLRCVARMRPV